MRASNVVPSPRFPSLRRPVSPSPSLPRSRADRRARPSVVDRRVASRSSRSRASPVARASRCARSECGFDSQRVGVTIARDVARARSSSRPTTPWAAASCSASPSIGKLALTGRVLGVSGAFKGLVRGDRAPWRVAFVGGLLAAGACARERRRAGRERVDGDGAAARARRARGRWSASARRWDGGARAGTA